MAMTHEELIKKFAERKINLKTKTVKWSGSNIFCDDNVIYSHGRHFPLAVYLGRDDVPFIKNSDHYSGSTSCHQNIVAKHCSGLHFSNSTLKKHKINFCDLKPENLFLFQEEFNCYLYKNLKTQQIYKSRIKYEESTDYNDFYKFDNRTLWEKSFDGEIKEFRKIYLIRETETTEYEKYSAVSYNRSQISILLIDNKYYFINKHDVTLLPKKPKSILDAKLQVATIKTGQGFSKLGSLNDFVLKSGK